MYKKLVEHVSGPVKVIKIIFSGHKEESIKSRYETVLDCKSQPTRMFLSQSPSSFEDIRTVDGRVSPEYREACSNVVCWMIMHKGMLL